MLLLWWPNTALVQPTRTNCKTLSQTSNIKKSHILLRASFSYKSGGYFCLLKGLTEWSLEPAPPPGVFQPDYIRVSAPKNSLCFLTCNGSVEHVGLPVPPRAGPGTELIITRDRTPALATSVDATAPFLSPPKETGMLKVGFSTTGFRAKLWFGEFREMEICPLSPCSTGWRPFNLAHSNFSSFPHSRQPPSRLLGTPREHLFLLSSLRPGCTGCLLLFWLVPPHPPGSPFAASPSRGLPFPPPSFILQGRSNSSALPEATTSPQNSSQEATFLPAAQRQNFEQGIRYNKSVYKDSAGYGLLPPFIAHYLACSRHSASRLNKKGSCVLNTARTLHGGQVWSWKTHLNRQDQRRLEIRRVSNAVWTSVRLVQSFQMGTFSHILNCKKREKKVLSVCVYIYLFIFISISIKGMPGDVAEQLKLYLFLITK